MADYIFKQWKEKLSAFESSVEKDLDEIRKCKAEMQQMKAEMATQIRKGRYVRDEQRLILSAPEIVIGNVDANGNLMGGLGSTVIIKGTRVGLHGVDEGGVVETRASVIRQTAEDPGIDGLEHVAYSGSSVIAQGRNIVLQSEDAEGAFSLPIVAPAGSGVRISSEQSIEMTAQLGSETREKRLDALIKSLEARKAALKKEATAHKKSFEDLQKEVEELLDKNNKLQGDHEAARSNYLELGANGELIESYTESITYEMAAYTEILSMLSEVNRQITCYKKQKGNIVKGDDFKKKTTGAHIDIAAENISMTSIDADSNLRDNEGSGIIMQANEVKMLSEEYDGALKKEGKVSIAAKTVEVATAGETGKEYDDKGKLTKSTSLAEGDIIMRSKNITMESLDYEVADGKRKEKALTADSTISMRSKTIEVSTEGSANVEVDDKGKTTKANYTAEGDIKVRTKTFSVESTDNDLADGKLTEKALTKDSSFNVRAEKLSMVATDTEGKATGSLSLNAKAVGVKSMDVDKEKLTDKSLAEGSTMLLLSEKMFVGAKKKDTKSKKVQVMTEEMALLADKTLEAQQGEGKAVMQLEGGNAAISGSKTAVYGTTTINAATEVKAELKAPKATIDNLEAKSSFKSTNISDGIAVPAAGGSGSLGTKLKAEDAPEK